MSIPVLKRLEHGVKRMFFALSRMYLKKGHGITAIDPEHISKILFIRPEKLGDMVISLPVFHHLKRLCPHIKIYTICSPKNIAIVREDGCIEKNFLYTKNIVHDFDMMQEVRKLRIDVVADMICDDSVTALFLTQYSSPTARRIGLGKTRHRQYYDFNYIYRSDGAAHVVDNTIKLLTALGIDTDGLDLHVPPTIRKEYFASADDFISGIKQDDSETVIGLNISAGRPTRVWPDEKNKALLGKILDSYRDSRIIISSDPSERGRAVALAGQFLERVHVIPARLNLLEVSAIISRMKLLITPDTSLVHIARSFKVPVVGLYTQFGNNFRLWKPYNQEGGAVISNNDYNIFDIDVEDVYLAVVKLFHPEVKA